MFLKDFEVVISGIGARFPDANNVEEFKEKLLSKSNMLVHDFKRWNPAEEDSPFYSGKMADWNRFDGNFFGMHPKMVRNCDPIHGLMLEKSYEAMVDAGINPFTTVKKNISVICAAGMCDAELIRMNDGLFLEGLGMVGHSRTMMANRISYTFNLSGPSYYYDSTWSSGMEALDKAVSLVAEGAVDGALVVGCALMAYNTVDLEYRRLNMLAPGDKCSPFDAEANGFVRSESVVAFFIQRAQDAKRTYCGIVNTDVLLVGDKPCGYLEISPMIETFLSNFYQNCKVNPSDVSYLEAGSVCNKSADTVELNGVANAFCLQDTTKPLLIGSVMGNVGNTESASGLVSLTKVIIALETGVIPPTINYNTPNPDVPALVSGKLKPVTEPTDLPGDLVGTSSIGICGTVAHVLVKRHNKTKQTLSAGELPEDGLPRLILLQARHEEGARAVVDKVQSMTVDVEFIALANDVFQKPVTNYLWRSYAVLPSASDGAQAIQLFEPIKRPIWFIFTGMGSQWAGMGQELLKLPVFAAAVDKCDKVLRPRGVDVMHILTTGDATVFENILNCFVGISTVQIGLVDILKTLGVTPDGMIGHSAGELGCSYADGCLTAEETVLAAYSRGRASLDADYKDIGGMMAAVGMGYNDIKDRLPESLDVACHNAADSCTLSGPEEDVLQYVGQLKQQGVFAKAVSAGGIAYHSRYIRTAAPKLLHYLKETIPNPKPRSSRWVSSSAPEANWDSKEARLCSPEYHTNNLLNPVLFEEACRHLPKDAILIEIAPHGLLQAILKRSVSNESINIPLTNKGAESNLNYFLNAVGKLYLNNVSVDVNALFPAVQYPVSRGTPSLVDLVTWNHEAVCYKEYSARIQKMLSRNSLEKIVDINTNHPDYQEWKEHTIDGKVVVPFSHLVLLPWKMILAKKRLHFEEECIVMEDVTVSDQLLVDGSENQIILVTTGPATMNFEVSRSTHIGLTAKRVVKGKLDVTTPITFSPPEYKEEETTLIAREEVYSVLAQFGWNYGLKVQNIRNIAMKDSGCVARVEWTGDVATFLDQMILILIFLQTDREQSRCLLLHFTKMTVNVPVLTGNIKGSDLEVVYDKPCNTLVCKGVQLCGPIISPVARHTPLNLAWTETKYQPYYQTTQSLKEFWSACLNLVSDAVFSSWSDNPVPTQIVFVKPDDEEPNDINAILKEALNGKYFNLIKPKEVNVIVAKKLIESPMNHGCIVAANKSVLKTMMNWPLVPDNVFFFTYETNNLKTATGFQKLKPILSYESLERNLHLLKKITNLTNSNVFELDESNWLDNLRQLMSRRNDRSTTIVVSRSLKPKEVLPILAKEPYVQNIRTIFLLDSNTPPFKLSNPFYYDQLSLGLFVNILYRGIWNSLSNISLNIDPKRKTFNSPVKSSETGMDVTFISLNTTYFNSYQHEKEEEPKIKYVDYVGYSSGEKVMGLAKYDPSSHSVTPDPILRWTVPEHWTMEDAATVPVIYAMAYYCMNFKATKEKTVLIHAAMSPIGQALVRLALGLDRDIFVSVINNKEVEMIMKLFPSLKRKNIFVLEVDNIEMNIKRATSGEGVDLVINCLQGKHVRSTVRIVGHYGQFINLAAVNIDARESLGMSVFLKSVTFNAVSLNKLDQCSDHWKQTLTNNVKKGINKGIVVPLNRKVFTYNELTTALRNLKDNQLKEKTVLHLESKRGSGCNDTVTLALIAGTRTDLWLDVAEWLVRRGTRRLLVLTDESQLSRNHKRRFNKLTKHFNVDAVISSAGRLDTHKSTKELLEDMQPIGTISTIVCVGMDENSSRMKNLDAASREAVPAVRQFVSLLGEGAAVSESRARSGLAVCHVQSVSTLQQPALVLPYLSALLDHDHVTPAARFLTVTARDTTSSTTTSSKAGFQTFLPSLTELNRSCDINPDNPGFTEVTTLSPGYSFVKHDLAPIFIVPGLDVTRLEPLLKRLIHPAFCCTMSSFIENIDQFAEMLMEEVLHIQSQGPYNIVGDSWGGASALALGCLLEARGHQVQLFLIEGAPPTIQGRIQALCNHYNTDIGSSILANILNLPSEVVKEVARLKKWEEKLAVGLEKVAQDVRDSVGKPLTSLYNQLTAVQLSKPPAQPFKGRVTLITCKQPSSADLAKLTQTCLNLQLVATTTKDYCALIDNYNTATVVNENLLFY